MSLPRRTNRPYDIVPNCPYPPSPRGIRPFAQSRDSLHPPSLASPGGTVSTTTSASRSPRIRPRSLPPHSNDHHTSSHRSAPRIAGHDDYLLSDGPYGYQDHETEIDIGRFPSFARHWYPNHQPTARPPPTAYQSVPNTDSVSPFDPAFPTHKHNSLDSYTSFQKQPFSDFGYHSVPSSRNSHSRNVLPWVNEAQDPLLNELDPEVKKERIRMLEREFAGKDVGKGLDDDDNMIGSADQRGRLITQGPKKRLATRWFQALLTLGAAVSLIYIALVIPSVLKTVVLPLTPDFRRLNPRNSPRRKEQYPSTSSTYYRFSPSFLSPTSSSFSPIVASVGIKTRSLQDHLVQRAWRSCRYNTSRAEANTKVPRKRRRRKTRRVREERVMSRLTSLSIRISWGVAAVVGTRRKTTTRRVQVGWVQTVGGPMEVMEGDQGHQRGEVSLLVWRWRQGGRRRGRG